MQFFNKFSTISPGFVVLPLLIVLTISGAKDGYEDIKRHQSDRRVNNTPVRVLAGGDWVNTNTRFMGKKRRSFLRSLMPSSGKGGNPVKKAQKRGIHGTELAPPNEAPTNDKVEINYDVGVELSEKEGDGARPYWSMSIWEDVRVGDFVKIMDNESFPADILICSTSEDDDVAYVETKNLDGETNLKSRHATPPLTHLRTAADCADKRNSFHINCDAPDVNMYKLNATVVIGKEKSPVDQQMVLLRGCVLRNTKWVIGLVLFTGEDTKIVLNSGGTPSKRSKVERQTNPQV